LGAANLMLRRYGEKAVEESYARADELAAQDDLQWPGNMAPHHRRREPVGQHHSAWLAALTTWKFRPAVGSIPAAYALGFIIENRFFQ
jgi:hypothetical protein